MHKSQESFIATENSVASQAAYPAPWCCIGMHWMCPSMSKDWVVPLNLWQFKFLHTAVLFFGQPVPVMVLQRPTQSDPPKTIRMLWWTIHESAMPWPWARFSISTNSSFESTFCMMFFLRYLTIYIYLCAYIYVHTRTIQDIPIMVTNMYIYKYIYLHAHTHIYIYIYTCIYVYTKYMYLDVYIGRNPGYIYMYMYIYIFISYI